MKDFVIYMLALWGSIFASIGVYDTVTIPSQYPFGFVAVGVKSKLHTTVINSNVIMTVTPVFDPAIAVEKRKNKHVTHIEVTFAGGHTIVLKEDIEDFLNRIRNSMSQ